MAVPASALAAWELVGKQEEQQSRLTIKLLQRLYDRAPVWKLYESGSLEIHSHFRIGTVDVCAAFFVPEHRDFMESDKAVEREVHVYRDKFPVLVGVGKVAEKARPLASFVRLKLANHCGVFVADALKPGVSMRRETLRRILDGKLRTALGAPRVVLGEHVDQVVQ